MQFRFVFIIMALLLGAILPLQATINTRLSKIVGGPVVSAFVSFSVGTIALLLYLLITRQIKLDTIPFRESSWWMWIGGLLGAFFVAGIVVLLPRLGVALSFSLVVAGQMAIAILFDHYGWIGTTVREISLGKIAGAILLIAGVFLIRKF
ncbi:MAG: DMT family transporter [Bacteroidetes bacterium]|nr:DMT family transporter [Bacteroidota bacterium]